MAEARTSNPAGFFGRTAPVVVSLDSPTGEVGVDWCRAGDVIEAGSKVAFPGGIAFRHR
jgi:hypothetical protein